MPHRAAVNHLLWAQSAYDLRPGEAGLLKTPLGFDVSVREIFWPLSVGARVVIADLDPATKTRIKKSGSFTAKDRTGRTVHAGPVEATAIGNVLVQLRAAGA